MGRNGSSVIELGPPFVYHLGMITDKVSETKAWERFMEE